MSSTSADGVNAESGKAMYDPGLWSIFEDSLYIVLRKLSIGDALTLFAPPDAEGSSNCVIVRRTQMQPGIWVTVVTGQGPESEQLEATGSHVDTVPLAREIVALCRDRLGIPDPRLMTHSAYGSVAASIDMLALPRQAGRPTGCDPVDVDALDRAIPVANPAEVARLFAGVVEQVTGQVPELDEDGDLFFFHDGHTVYASMLADQPTVRLWAIVVNKVRSRRAAAVEISIRNRDDEWTEWLLQGRRVVQQSMILGGPFVPSNVDFQLSRFLLALASTYWDLNFQLSSDDSR